jgi:RNA polymerase sporulation-specific sigma factor
LPRHDERVLALVRDARRDGNRGQRAFETLLRDLEPDLRKVASRYYINGADYQDVLQEGRIGVWKAVQDFDPNGGMSFRNFCINLCVKRHVITAMAAANRKKYDLHNNSISLDTPISTGDDDNEQSLSDFIQDPNSPMIDGLLVREEFEENALRVKRRLTQLEAAIFDEYSFEESYRDIAESLGIKSKAVDNALMRVRAKSANVYQEYLSETAGDGEKDGEKDEE